MKPTLADPNRKWEGFRPTAYYLDSEKVLSLQLTHGPTIAEATIPTTVREIYERFAGKHIEEVDPSSYTEITADDETLVVKGPAFHQEILAAVLNLRSDDIMPFDTRWFWYDSDWATDDVHELYRFFVVHRDRIVLEQITFSDWPGNGYDPSVFQAADSDYGWAHGKGWRDAETRLWYRKFYRETRIGQLMILRSDKPKLYCYEDDRGHPETTALLVFDWW